MYQCTADACSPWYSETIQSVNRAYEDAGLGPEDLSLVELCDNSSWHFLEYCELIGLCGQGEASTNLRSGQFDVVAGFLYAQVAVFHHLVKPYRLNYYARHTKFICNYSGGQERDKLKQQK